MRRYSLLLVLVIASGCGNRQPSATPAVSTSSVSNKTATPTNGPEMPTTTFDSLFTDNVINSFDKQLRLADAHGDDAWGFDKANGEITFNKSVAYKIQILGSEDHVNKTWLWGWANKASKLPDNLLLVGNELRSLGEKHAITQLTTAKLSLDVLDGHTVGLIACGFANGKAYYRCPYENGALFVLITDDKLQLPVENKVVRATRVIPECIAALAIKDHRAATTAYLRQNGFDVIDNAGKLVVRADGKPVLTVEFDKMNRLTKVESQVTPKERK
jgi:Family of unknown function (DUF6882)